MLIFYRERARWGESCTFLPVRDFPLEKVLFLIIQWNPARYNEDPVRNKNISKPGRITGCNELPPPPITKRPRYKENILTVPTPNLPRCDEYFVRSLAAVSTNNRFERKSQLALFRFWQICALYYCSVEFMLQRVATDTSSKWCFLREVLKFC